MVRRSRLESMPTVQQNGEGRARVKKASHTPRGCKGRPKTPAPTPSYHASHAPQWMKHKKGKKKNLSKSATWNMDMDENQRGKTSNPSSGARTTSFGDGTAHQRNPRKKRAGRKKATMPSYSFRVAYAVGLTDDCCTAAGAAGAAAADKPEPIQQEYFELVAEQWGSKSPPGGGGGGGAGAGGGRGRGDRDRRSSGRPSATETTDKTGYSLAILRPMTPNGSPVIISTAMYSSSREPPPCGQGKNWSTCQSSSTGAGDSGQYMSFMSSYCAAPPGNQARTEDSTSSVPLKTYRSPSPHPSPLKSSSSTPASMPTSKPSSLPRSPSPSAATLPPRAPPPAAAPSAVVPPMGGRCTIEDSNRCYPFRRRSTPPREAPSVRQRPRGASPCNPAPAFSPRRHMSSPPVTTPAGAFESLPMGPHMEPHRASDNGGRAFAFPCLLQPTPQWKQSDLPPFETPPPLREHSSLATHVTSSYGTPDAPLFPQHQRKMSATAPVLLATSQLVPPLPAPPAPPTPPPRLPTTLPSAPPRVGCWCPMTGAMSPARPTLLAAGVPPAPPVPPAPRTQRPLSQGQPMATTDRVSPQHKTLSPNVFESVITAPLPMNAQCCLPETRTPAVSSPISKDPVILLNPPTMVSTATLPKRECTEGLHQNICEHSKTKVDAESLEDKLTAVSAIANMKTSTDPTDVTLLNTHGRKTKLKLPLLQTEGATVSNPSEPPSSLQCMNDKTPTQLPKRPLVPTSVEVTVSSPAWRDSSKLAPTPSIKKTKSSTSSVKVTVSSPASKGYLSSIAQQHQMIAQPTQLKKSKSSTTSFKISVSSVQQNKVVETAERPIMIIEATAKPKATQEKKSNHNLVSASPEKRIGNKQCVERQIDTQGKVSQLIKSSIDTKFATKISIKGRVESSETTSMTSSSTPTYVTETGSNNSYYSDDSQPRIQIKIPMELSKIKADQPHEDSTITDELNKNIKSSNVEKKEINEITTTQTDELVPIKHEDESKSSANTESPEKTSSGDQEESTECSLAREIIAAQNFIREIKDQTLSDISTISTLQEVGNMATILPASESATTISGDVSNIMETFVNDESFFKPPFLMTEKEKRYKMQLQAKEKTINCSLPSIANISCTSSSCSIDTIKPIEAYNSVINKQSANTLRKNESVLIIPETTTSISEALYCEDTFDLNTCAETIRPPSSVNSIITIDETPEKQALSKTINCDKNVRFSTPREEIVSSINVNHHSNFPELQKIHESLQNMTQFLSRRVEEVVSAVSLSSDGTRLSTRPLSQLARSTCDASIKNRIRPVSANAVLLPTYTPLTSRVLANKGTGLNLDQADSNFPSIDSLEMSSQMVANMIGLLSDTISELTGIPIRMASEMIKAGSKMRHRLEAVKRPDQSLDRLGVTHKASTAEDREEEPKSIDTKSNSVSKSGKRQSKVPAKEMDDKELKRSSELGKKHNKIDVQKVKNVERYKKHPKSPNRRVLIVQKREKIKNHSLKKAECAENKGVMTDMVVTCDLNNTVNPTEEVSGKEASNMENLQLNMESQKQKTELTKKEETSPPEKVEGTDGNKEGNVEKCKLNVENDYLKKFNYTCFNSKNVFENKQKTTEKEDDVEKCELNVKIDDLKKFNYACSSKNVFENKQRTEKEEENIKESKAEDIKTELDCLHANNTVKAPNASGEIDHNRVEIKNKQKHHTCSKVTELKSLIENGQSKNENEKFTKTDKFDEKNESARSETQRIKENDDDHPIKDNNSVFNERDNDVKDKGCSNVQIDNLKKSEVNYSNAKNTVKDATIQRTDTIFYSTTKNDDKEVDSQEVLKNNTSSICLNLEQHKKREVNTKVSNRSTKNAIRTKKAPRSIISISKTNPPYNPLSLKNTNDIQKCVTFKEGTRSGSRETSPERVGTLLNCPEKKLENKDKFISNTCYRVPRKRTRIQSVTQPITTDIDYPAAENYEINKISDTTSDSSSSCSTHTVKEAVVQSKTKQALNTTNNMCLHKSLVSLIKNVQICGNLKTSPIRGNLPSQKEDNTDVPEAKSKIKETGKLYLINSEQAEAISVEKGPQNNCRNDLNINRENMGNITSNFPTKSLWRKRAEYKKSSMRLRKPSKIPDSWNPLQLDIPSTIKFSDFRVTEDLAPKELTISVPSKPTFEFQLPLRKGEVNSEVRPNIGSKSDSSTECFTNKTMKNNDISETPERDTNANTFPTSNALHTERIKSKETVNFSLQRFQSEIKSKETGNTLNISSKSHSNVLSFLGDKPCLDMEKKISGTNCTNMMKTTHRIQKCETLQMPTISASTSLLFRHPIKQDANDSQIDINCQKDRKQMDVRCSSAFAGASSNISRRKTAVKKWLEENLYPTQNIIFNNSNESFKHMNISSKCEIAPKTKKYASVEKQDFNKNVLEGENTTEISPHQNENPINEKTLKQMKEVKSTVIWDNNSKRRVKEYELFRVSNNLRNVLPRTSSKNKKSNNYKKNYNEGKINGSMNESILDTSIFDTDNKNKHENDESVICLTLKMKAENDVSKQCSVYEKSGSKEILNEKLLSNTDGIAPKKQYTLNMNNAESGGKSSSIIGWSQAFDKYRSFQKLAQSLATKNIFSVGKAASEKSLSRKQKNFFDEPLIMSSMLDSQSVIKKKDRFMFSNDLFLPTSSSSFHIYPGRNKNDHAKGMSRNKQKRMSSATKNHLNLMKDDDKKVELQKRGSTASPVRQSTFFETCSRTKFPFPNTVRKDEKMSCSWGFGNTSGLTSSEFKTNACPAKCHSVRFNTAKCSSTSKGHRTSLVQRNYSKSARLNKVALVESACDLSDVPSPEIGSREGETHAFLVRVKQAFTREPTISLERINSPKTNCRRPLDSLPSAYLTAPKSTTVSTWIDDKDDSFNRFNSVSITRLAKTSTSKTDSKMMSPSVPILSKMRCERKTYGQVTTPEDACATKGLQQKDMRLPRKSSALLPPPLPPKTPLPLVSTVGTSISLSLATSPMRSSKEDVDEYEGSRRTVSRDHSRRPPRGVVWGRRWCKHARGAGCDRVGCSCEQRSGSGSGGEGGGGGGKGGGGGRKRLAFCESVEESCTRKTPRVDQRLKEAVSRKRAWKPGTRGRRRGLDAASALRDCKYLCSLAAVLDRLAAVYREADTDDLDDCPTEDEVTWDSSGCGVQIKQPSSASPLSQRGEAALTEALVALEDDGSEKGTGESGDEGLRGERSAHQGRERSRVQRPPGRRSSRIPVLRRQQPYVPEYPNDAWCFGLSE